ncbi:MAG: TfoX/Sxy family protein [Armatimonadota bacterium]
MTIEEANKLLKDVPNYSHRAMFGGHGLYSNGRVFALFDDGHIFLKGDAISAPIYEESGGIQFSYISNNGPMSMKYWRFLTNEILLENVDNALETVQRSPAPKPKKPKAPK